MRFERIFFVCSVLCAACTVDNPLYAPIGDLSAAPIDSAGRDLAGASDLATASMCNGDQRMCSGTAAERCEVGMFVTDRTCPTSSTCAEGHCVAPTDGVSCTFDGTPSETVCLDLGAMATGNVEESCQPFVGDGSNASGSVGWICGAPVGVGAVGTPCTVGSQCRTGFCGSNGTCFRSCAAAVDCPTLPGKAMRTKCSQVTIDVEGQQIPVDSCIP